MRARNYLSENEQISHGTEPQRQTRTSQRAVNLNKEKDPLLLHRWFVEGYGFQPCRQDPPLSKVL